MGLNMKKKNSLRNLCDMIKMAWKENRFFILFQLFLNTIRGPFPLLIAYINKLIVDKITGELHCSSEFEYLVILVFLTIIIQVIYEFLMTLDTKLAIISSNRIFVKIQSVILEKLRTLDKAHYDKTYDRDIIHRGKNFDYKSIHNLMNSISNIFRRVFTAIVAAIVLIKYNYLLTIFILVMYIAKIIIGRISVDLNKQMNESVTERVRRKEYYSEIVKSKKYAKELRVFGLNEFFINKYKSTSREIFELNKKYIRKNIILNGGIDILQILINGILYGILVLGAFYSKITLGDITFIKSAFDNLNSELYASISMLIDLYKDISTFDFFSDFTNLKNEIIKNEKDRDSYVNFGINRGKHRIEFKHVYFSYPDTENYILKDINLVINEGDTIGLVGINGAGKSTLIKLLLRLYDCTKGCILVDGIDIKKYDPKQYYAMWGFQSQESILYPMKLKNNIALGIDEQYINLENIHIALKHSNGENIIKKMKHSENTEIYKVFDSEGYEPSGGEAQKISLARTFYKDCEMYILDEPSSAMDADSENKIFHSLNQVLKSKTVIFISHKLSNFKFCDKIVILKEGKIVAEGTHRELMDNVYYSQLYMTQKNSFLNQNER